MTNHELAKRYIEKQNLMGINQLDIELIDGDGVILWDIDCREDLKSVRIPSFITKYSRSFTFGGSYYEEIIIESDAKLDIRSVFNSLESERVYIKFKGLEVSDVRGMFNGCKMLEDIKIDGLDVVGERIEIDNLYKGCSRLKSVDLSYIRGTVRSMIGVFSGCRMLEGVYGLDGIDASKVKDISNLYYGCKSMAYIDIDKLGIKKLCRCNRLISGCEGLKELRISGTDMSQVTDMLEMYHNCGLKEINISKLDLSDIEEISGLFSDCRDLEVVDISNLKLRQVRKLMGYGGLYHIFSGCNKLKELVVSIELKDSNIWEEFISVVRLESESKNIEIIYK